MEGKLYIPYINTEFNEDEFDYKGNDFNYINSLNNVKSNIVGVNTYNDYLDHKPKNRIGYNNVNRQSDEFYSDLVLYHELDIKLTDYDDSSVTIDTLLKYFTSKESFMLTFSFDVDESGEDVLLELKSWLSESKKVMDLPNEVYDEDMKIGLLPKREFKLKLNKANAFLEECIFFDSYENKIVIFVKKITFYK